MACSSLNVQSTIKDSPPINSMSSCADIAKDGHYTTFGEVLEKLVDTITMYNECQIKHQGLVDYEKEKK